MEYRRVYGLNLRNKQLITEFCNAVEDYSLWTIKTVNRHANRSVDPLLSGHQSVNPLRDAIDILSKLYK